MLGPDRADRAIPPTAPFRRPRHSAWCHVAVLTDLPQLHLKQALEPQRRRRTERLGAVDVVGFDRVIVGEPGLRELRGPG